MSTDIDRARSGPPGSRPGPAPDGGPARVLVALVAEPLRRAVCRALAADGHRVEAACSAAELLGCLAAGMLRLGGRLPPDLVVTEAELPGFRALDLVAGLRADGWATPVLLTASPLRPGLWASAIDLDSTLVYSEPVEVDDLRAAIDVLLDGAGRRARAAWPGRPCGAPGRRERRAGLRRRADLEVEEFLGARRLVQRCTDIGFGGMFLTATARPEPGAVLTRRLAIPPTGGRAIWFRGEVVHCDGRPRRRGVGIRYLEVSEADRLVVARYVLSLPRT